MQPCGVSTNYAACEPRLSENRRYNFKHRPSLLRTSTKYPLCYINDRIFGAYMASNRSSGAQAEVALLPSLKSCLLNLPSSLVSVLLNSNTLAQNVVVELSFRAPVPPNADLKQRNAGVARSIFMGWTGMRSQTRLAPVVGRDGIAGRDGSRQEQEVSVVEVDATFARLVGLGEGTKVGENARKYTGYCRLIANGRLMSIFTSIRPKHTKCTLNL